MIVSHGVFVDGLQILRSCDQMSEHVHTPESKSCDHSHSAGHVHGDVSSADGRRRVAIAGLLTAAFMVAEVAGGLISGSLALLADAAHMTTDAASLGLAWFGYHLAARPADATHTYGQSRFKILAAFTNGVALIALAVWITIEGVHRLLEPQPVLGPLLLTIAILGLIVNLISFAVLHGGDQDDLNLRGALWHVAGDLLGSIAAIVAAIIIIHTGWMPIDPILSIFVALLVAVAGWRIAGQAARILIQATPAGLSADEVTAALTATIEGLESIEDLHLWSLTEKQSFATLTARLSQTADPEATRDAIRAQLKQKFGISQTTIEVR